MSHGPDGPLGWTGQLWALGCAAVVVVVLATILSHPTDLSLPARLFVWASTGGFTVWLLRVNRSTMPRARRLVLFGVCGGGWAVLSLVLGVSAL